MRRVSTIYPDPRFAPARVLEETFALFDTLGLTRSDIPLIIAGGIDSHEKVRDALALGARAVQLGTAFAVTEECDAHPNFKNILAGATPEDIVTFVSAAGLVHYALREIMHSSRFPGQPQISFNDLGVAGQ